MADATETKIIVTTPAELRALMREVVAEAVAEMISDRAASAPALLDRQGAAKFLNVSIATLDRLVKDEGLPHVYVGDARRFEPAVVTAYLRVRAATRNAPEGLRVVEGGRE